MLRRLLFLGLLCTTASACKEDVAQFVFDARIVDGDNGNPAAGTDATTLLIGIQEGELPAETFDYPITDGQFEAVLEFRAFTEPTRIRVGIEGSTTELLTAPPQFVPWLSQGFMRVVTAPPSSCVPVGFNVMEAPRVRFGMVQSGTFALVAGGTTPSDVQLEFFDVLRWDSNTNTLDDLNEALEPFGETRATRPRFWCWPQKRHPSCSTWPMRAIGGRWSNYTGARDHARRSFRFRFWAQW
ncbi:MAG: hypothetical protein EP303_03405 [Deltaproteobacteria bacterium]|nr:MAG: hypothetical protein EP303_03405 [Deltaproteobacteria bacterium]